MLRGLAGLFISDSFPVLNKSACLNTRNRFEPCKNCECACTYGALAIDAGLPVIDERKCIHCGLCASVCPSEALRLKDYQVFRSISGSDEIRCVMCGGMYCIRALSAEFIASVIVMKHDMKFVMPCEKCKLSEKIHDDNFNFAIRFVNALGIHNDVKIIREAESQNEISRREVLSSFFAWGKNKGSNILEDVIFHDRNNFFLARKFLHDSPNDSHGEIETGVFYDFSVSESCNACGVCEAMCPHGAWKISKHDGKAELKFYITECTGCMLCVKKCPENALSLCEKISWPPESESLKKELNMIRCRHCGKWFIVNEPEQELCTSCSGRK